MAGETVTAATIIDAPAEAIFGSSRPGQARRDRRHRLGLRMTRRRSRTSSANTPDSPRSLQIIWAIPWPISPSWPVRDQPARPPSPAAGQPGQASRQRSRPVDGP